MQDSNKKEIKRVVNWCLKRADELFEDDALSLLAEFDEWIGFEERIVKSLDIMKIKTNNPKYQ